MMNFIKNTTRTLVVLMLAGVCMTGIYLTLFQLDETETAAIVRWDGKPIRNCTEPGLNWRIPIYHNVKKYDSRIQKYDSKPDQVLTSDMKKVVIDEFSPWKIVDPILFMQTVGPDIEQGHKAMDDRAYPALRDEITRNTFHSIVVKKRGEILAAASKKSQESMKDYGIFPVQVFLNKVELPKANEGDVFARMSAERARMAEKYRSLGKMEKTKIMSASDLRYEEILAEAYKQGKQIRGEAKSEVLKMWNKAFGEYPKFIDLCLALDALVQGMGPDSGTTKRFIFNGKEPHLAPLFKN